jgi:hypothetical protein
MVVIVNEEVVIVNEEVVIVNEDMIGDMIFNTCITVERLL